VSSMAARRFAGIAFKHVRQALARRPLHT
jgi:hypothetical protein